MQKLSEYKRYVKELTFDTIFQQAPIGIAISHTSDPFYTDNKDLVSINPVFEQITGRTKEELTKLGWAKISHPDVGMAYRCKYDRNWTMQFVSEGCFELTVYTPENLLNNKKLSFKDLITPLYHKTLWKEWERILAARLPFKYEYEIITAKGWDGYGYPRGLSGEQIPTVARIISIVETYERVLNRGNFSLSDRKKKAIEIIKEGAGKQFDPAIAELFTQMMEK